MKIAIPPSTTIAPIAMMIAELPVNPLPLPAVAVVWIVGVAVVVVGIETDGWGNPPLSGLVVWAPADEGSVSASGPATRQGRDQPRHGRDHPREGDPPEPASALRNRNPPESHGPALRERLLHRRRVGRGDVGLLVLDVLLVVHALGVDRPDVVVGSREDVVDGAHRSQHRVV